MPICPEHAASTSPVRGSLVAGQPPPFSARIVWDDQSSVSSDHEDPKCMSAWRCLLCRSWSV